MWKSLLVFTTLSMSGVSLAGTALRVNPDRTVSILGVIDATLIPKAERLLGLSSDLSKPIDVIINSPGGSIEAGQVFILSMKLAKARGARIRCVVPIMAASMAFSILLHCSERYVFPTTLLLYHPARAMFGFGSSATAKDLKELQRDMETLDRELLLELYASLGMHPNLLKESFEREYLWRAKDLIHHIKSGWLIFPDMVLGADPLLFKVQEGK